MNARIASLSTRAAIVSPYGFNMLCEFEYEEEEPAIVTAQDGGHPGSPANAQLLVCKVGDTNIFDMLDPQQIETIEEACIKAMEE
jgi:hypothetical protein